MPVTRALATGFLFVAAYVLASGLLTSWGLWTLVVSLPLMAGAITVFVETWVSE